MKRKYPVDGRKKFTEAESNSAIAIKDRLTYHTKLYGKAATRALFQVFDELYLADGGKYEIK